MKIQYDILWIEDDERWIKSIQGRALKPLIEAGLEPIVIIAKNAKEALSSIKNTQFDLILVDYRLDASTGDDVIQEIRRKSHFTTILFYSSDGDIKIRKHISDKSIDGVFCSDRAGAHFIKAVHDLIGSTTRKFQHINNVRGLAMAEVSEMEEMMVDILHAYFESNSGEIPENLKKYIIKTLQESSNNNITSLSKLLEEGDILKIVRSRPFDAEKRAMAIQKLAKYLTEEMNDLHEFHNSYKIKISNNRNILGHVKEDYEEGITYLSHKGGKLICDEKFCIEFRGDLRAHKQLLIKLQNHINPPSKETSGKMG